MYKYPIELELRSGAKIEAVANDTQRNDNREECIEIEIEGVASLVTLDSILKMKVRVDNPHFKEISFGDTV